MSNENSQYLIDPAFGMRRFVDRGISTSHSEQSFKVYYSFQQLGILIRRFDTGKASRQIPFSWVSKLSLIPQKDKTTIMSQLISNRMTTGVNT